MAVKALIFAAIAHKGQKDKAGKSYIRHPMRVAKALKGKQYKEAALLHDVVEDTKYTLDDIRKLFGDTVADAVDAMTRRKGEPLMKYLDRVKDNKIALAVKIEDLLHNADLFRCSNVGDEEIKRTRRYCYEVQYLVGFVKD